MLTQVDVRNSSGGLLNLPLASTSSGYSVREIDGLDPVSATLTTSSLAQVDGAQPQNAHRDTRNITIKLGMEPDFVTSTVQSLRSNLYSYFMPKANVVLTFYIDNVATYVISGQVEDFVAPLFTDNPEADISIICYDPDFYALAPAVFDSVTVSDTAFAEINYDGTSEAGVIFALSVNAAIDGFQVYNTTPDGTVRNMSVTASFEDGDVVTIDTRPGSKSVMLLRSGISSSLLYALDDAVQWIVLQKGINFFRSYADSLSIPYTVTYTPKYGGL